MASIFATTGYAGDDALPRKLDDSLAVLSKKQGNSRIHDIVSLLADFGYFAPRIELAGDDCHVTPGVRSVLEMVHLSGDTAYGMSAHIPFSREAVANILAGIAKGYARDGHLYAQITADSIRHFPSAVVVFARVSKGPVVVLGELRFSGTTRSNPSIIQRMLDTHRGDTLTTDYLNELEHRCKDIEFLRFIAPLQLFPLDGFTAVDIECRFQEKSQVEIFGGAAMVPGERQRMAWHGQATIQNLFGSGKFVQIDADQATSARRELTVRYAQPTFLAGIGRWEMEVTTRDFVDAFYEFQTHARWSIRSRSFATIGAGLGWRSVEYEILPSFTSWSATIRAAYNDRMSLETRTHYWRGLTEFTSSYRRYRSDSLGVGKPHTIDTRATIELESGVMLRSPIMLRMRAAYNGLHSSDSIPLLSELIFIGGPPELRGYSNDQFAVSNAMYGSIEPYVILPSGSTGLFVDWALLSSKSRLSNRVITDDDVKLGYGWQIRFDGESSSLALSLAWNPDIRFNQPRLAIAVLSRL